MAHFKKIVRLGLINGYGKNRMNVFCKINLKEKDEGLCLSISGVEGPLQSGNARGGCGQIIMSGIDIVEFAPGWNRTKLNKFLEIWNKWHLNSTNAGTVEQDKIIEKAKKQYPDKFQTDHYESCCTFLKEADLYEDSGHKYGSAWLFRELPKDVVEFLKALPDTNKTPAWV